MKSFIRLILCSLFTAFPLDLVTGCSGDNGADDAGNIDADTEKGADAGMDADAGSTADTGTDSSTDTGDISDDADTTDTTDDISEDTDHTDDTDNADDMSDDTDDTDDTDDIADNTDDKPDADNDQELPVGCAELIDGWNTGYPVGTETYDLYLHIPRGAAENGSGHWAVVFNWHSLGTTAHDFDGMISDIYNNDVMPFIGVTPNSNGHKIMGIDMTWDIAKVNPEANADIALFDSLLACLDARFGIDPNHIHSMGFSLGGIMTDVLATTRGDVLASVATYSGGYLSDDANVATLGWLARLVNWPDPVHQNRYAQLLTHSGAKDTYNLLGVVVHFDRFANNDVPYLNALGHDVILCANASGSRHGDLSGLPSPMNFVEFFSAHPLGTYDSPWMTALPESGFELCSVSPKD